MATAQDEYLEYKTQVNDEMENSRRKIGELKQQLAEMNVNSLKGLAYNIMNLSPTKTKHLHKKFLGKSDVLGSQNYKTEENVIFNTQDRREIYGDRYLDEEEKEEEFYRSKSNEQILENFGSPIAQINLPDRQTDPELATLFKNLKEKQDVYQSLKNRIMDELANLNEKQTECEEIEDYFKSRAMQAGQAEQLIKNEINEVKERLEIIQVIKKREKLMSLKNKKKWILALQNLESKIDELKVKQKELEERIQRIKQDAEDLHTLEIKKFKEVLRETEKALEKIGEERKRDEERLVL
jgi:hypothetical protein